MLVSPLLAHDGIDANQATTNKQTDAGFTPLYMAYQNAPATTGMAH